MLPVKNIIPLGCMVLLEAVAPNKTEGGLIIPEQAKDDQGNKYYVRKLGDDVVKDLEPGDRVALDFSGVAVLVEPGSMFPVIDEKYIVAVIDE